MDYNTPIRKVADVTPPGEKRRFLSRRSPEEPRAGAAIGWAALVISFIGVALVIGRSWPLYQPTGPEADGWRIAGSSLGLAGIILASVAWIRRELARVCAVAVVVGLFAIFWEWVWVGLIAIAILIGLVLVTGIG